MSEHSTGLMYDENLPLNPRKRQCVIYMYIFTTCLHVDFNYFKVQIHTYTDIFTINMPAWWYVLINVFQTMSIYNLIYMYSYGECPLENANTNLILYIKHMFITLYVYLWWKHEWSFIIPFNNWFILCWCYTRLNSPGLKHTRH